MHPFTPKLRTPKFEFELASGLGSGWALGLGLGLWFVYPFTPKLCSPKLEFKLTSGLWSGLALGLGFVYPLTPKPHTPPFWLVSLCSNHAALDGKVGRERRLEGGAPRAGVGPSGLSSGRGWGAAWEGGVSVQSRGRVGKVALLAFLPAPPFPAGCYPCPAPSGGISSVPLLPDLTATFLWGWVWGFGAGEGVLSAPSPHPTRLCPGAGHDCLPPGCGPHGADPPVASRGLCGVMGGGSPPLGRLLARCLPPLALDRSASAGRRSSAALGLLCGRQSPPHALRASGLAPNPASPRVPRLSCLVLSPSRLLTSVVSLARLAPRFLSEPLPSALGGRGRRVPGARVGDPGGWGERSWVGGAAVWVEIFF